MKRFSALLLAGAMLLCLSPRAQAAPGISAKSAVLVDGATGRVLYEKDAQTPREIASITKLMTALVAAESTPLDRTITVKREHTLAEGSSMYLREGETISLEELLWGLLLASGNDAALAVAELCAGDTATFVEWMNAKADELGMEHTHFMNPSGLPQEEHYSSAADMAKLAVEVMKQETLARMVATQSKTVGERTLTNHNKLLWRYEGCVGMKTGYTDRAGRTLVSCAKRGERSLICVTLNDPNDWEDHAALLDYGFSHWTGFLLARAGREYCSVPVTGALVRFVPVRTESGVYYPLSAEERVTAKLRVASQAEAPIREGTIAGSLTFYLDGEEIGRTYLVYARNVASSRREAKDLLSRVRELFRRDAAAALEPKRVGEQLI